MAKSTKEEVKAEIKSVPTVESTPKGVGVIVPEKQEPKQPENWTGTSNRDYRSK